MNRLPKNIKIGTCSCKYDSWKGLVYSDSVGKSYLSEYSKHYDIVEITLNVNNHYEGSAPMTIDRFLNLFLKDAFI